MKISLSINVFTMAEELPENSINCFTEMGFFSLA